jgi:hypothetical protein
MPDAAPLTIATLLAKRMACSSFFAGSAATCHAVVGLATGQ